MHPVTVACIVDGDRKLIESNVISEYLDRQYSDSGIQLFPRDTLSLIKVTEAGSHQP